jgi:hypothetical protein
VDVRCDMTNSGVEATKSTLSRGVRRSHRLGCKSSLGRCSLMRKPTTLFARNRPANLTKDRRSGFARGLSIERKCVGISAGCRSSPTTTLRCPNGAASLRSAMSEMGQTRKCGRETACPFHPQEQTSAGYTLRSVWCQQRKSAVRMRKWWSITLKVPRAADRPRGSPCPPCG